MKLKKCTCGKDLTTKNVHFNGVGDMGDKEIVYFTCKACGSTMVLAGHLVSDEVRHELVLSLLDENNLQKKGA